METNIDLTTESLLPYVRPTESGFWMWPVIGVMVAILFGAAHFENKAMFGVAIAAYLIGVFAVVFVNAKRQGVQGTMGAMPKPLKRNMIQFWIASGLVAGCGVGIALATNFLVAGIVCGAIFAALGTGYHLRARSIMRALMAAA